MWMRRADVIDEDIQPAERRDGLSDQVGGAIWATQIRRNETRLKTLDEIEHVVGNFAVRPMTTRAPSSASARATARPIPLLAPVTTATFPVRCRSMLLPFALPFGTFIVPSQGRALVLWAARKMAKAATAMYWPLPWLKI